MNFGDACQLARSALRDLKGDSYDLTDVQNAVRLVIGELILVGRLGLTSTTVALTPGSETLTISGPANFRPERVMRAEIGYRIVQLSNYGKVARLLADGVVPGAPEQIAILPDSTAFLYPAPTSADTLRLWYVPASPALVNNSDVIDLPDEYVRPVIWQGVPLVLRHAGQEPNPVNPVWSSFYQLIYRICGDRVGLVNEPDRDPKQFL